MLNLARQVLVLVAGDDKVAAVSAALEKATRGWPRFRFVRCADGGRAGVAAGSQSGACAGAVRCDGEQLNLAAGSP